MRYFITFCCYGAHLRGDGDGAVDRRRNLYGTPTIEAHAERALAERSRMREQPFRMDDGDRRLVLGALAEVCGFRGWGLVAAHVRTNHVHVVVEAEVRPERVMEIGRAHV